MLHKEHISNIEIYSDEWHSFRMGKFTSSKMYTIIGEKSLTQGAMTYIYQKVGEEITGQSTADFEEQVEDENTIWGLQYELEALQKFKELKKVEFLATQKLISNPDKRFSSTPDAIWIHGVCLNNCEYNVSTAEVKCPRKFHKFFPLYACKTPSELKSFNKNYYWQVIDQMDNCGSAVGYFICYHPLFPAATNMRIIEFRKIDLWDDFKLLAQRKKQAVEEFEKIRHEFVGF
jgi:hypothetical protein